MTAVAPLRILTVCADNVGRSAMAQYWLRAALPADAVVVESAGTDVVPGSGMDARSRDLTVRFGGDPTGHAARRLDAASIAGADLVLGMAREHRDAVIALDPSSERRAFTIVELERLIAVERFSALRKLAASIDDAPGVRLAAMLDAIAAHRTESRRSDEPSIDVVDPARRDDEVVQRSAAQLLPAVETTVELVRTALR